MSTLAVTHPTLLDLAKRQDPDNKISTIVEMLNQTNEVLDDMAWMEGNLETGHRTTIRSGLPTPTWRKLYEGVQPTKSTTVQVTDNTGMLEAYAEVDKALADLNGNTAAFRLSEDRAHIEGISQEIASTTFYGNETTEPEAFTGLAPRFNSLSAENGENILSGGGSGNDQTSIWLVIWGDQSCHGIVPKGSTAGLKMTDMGEQTIGTPTGGYYQGYRTHYRFDAGLTVRDWRYIVRIANIDVTELNKDASSSSAELTDLMIQATELVPNMNAGRAAFYMNRNTRSFLRRQIKNDGNMRLTERDFLGASGITRATPMFDGIPIRRCDAILNTESPVT